MSNLFMEIEMVNDVVMVREFDLPADTDKLTNSLDILRDGISKGLVKEFSGRVRES